MRLFVRILLGVATLIVLLLVAVAAVVATIDKRALLAPLEAWLETLTGRDVVFGAEQSPGTATPLPPPVS